MASGSYDQSAVVWDMATAQVGRQGGGEGGGEGGSQGEGWKDLLTHLSHSLSNPRWARQPLKKWARIHEAPILDLAWRNETSLATGSADKTIKLLDLKQEGPEPLQTFRVGFLDGQGMGRGSSSARGAYHGSRFSFLPPSFLVPPSLLVSPVGPHGRGQHGRLGSYGHSSRLLLR